MKRLLILLLIAAMPALAQTQSPDAVWEHLGPAKLLRGLEARTGAATRLRLTERIADVLKTKQLVLPLPDPSGRPRWTRFRIEESPVLAAGLAKKYPHIRSFRAVAVDDPSITARINLARERLTAIILTPGATYHVAPDPAAAPRSRLHLSFAKNAVAPVVENARPRCNVRRSKATVSHTAAKAAQTIPRRRYRLAIATTGEYTAFQATQRPDLPAKEAAFEAVVATIDLVQAVYERELAIEMELVEQELDLIQTDPLTDGYTNDDSDKLLDENQRIVDRILGRLNYDIGHVFSTAGGGLAEIACVCDDRKKARGETGVSEPLAAPSFAIDYVAHEMGHQFGADHSFNGSTGACGSGNRVEEMAFEPGSGSTVMSYAGICGSDNVAEHSVDYFHVASLRQITNYLGGQGGRCARVTETSNRPPRVASTLRPVIPAETPFSVQAKASDPDNDAVTLTWEEYYDPSFKPAWKPVPSPPIDDEDGKTRPLLISAATGSVTSFDWLGDPAQQRYLPDAARVYNVAVTARDGRGGFTTAGIPVTVHTQAGPFRILQPVTGARWAAGSTQEVRWNVAKTDASPISTKSVRVLLSLDGGATFPQELIARTANDGSAKVTLPASGGNAVIRVVSIGNVFFAQSDGFTIE